MTIKVLFISYLASNPESEWESIRSQESESELESDQKPGVRVRAGVGTAPRLFQLRSKWRENKLLVLS